MGTSLTTIIRCEDIPSRDAARHLLATSERWADPASDTLDRGWYDREWNPISEPPEWPPMDAHLFLTRYTIHFRREVVLAIRTRSLLFGETYSCVGERVDFFDDVAFLNRHFRAVDCLITYDHHRLVEQTLRGTSFDEALDTLGPWEGDVPHPENLIISTERMLGYWRFTRGLPNSALLRPWPPIPQFFPVSPPPSPLPMDPIPVAELEDLTHQLLWETRSRQVKAAGELASHGPRAIHAVPALIEGLSRRHPSSRAASAMALLAVGDPSARSDLRQRAELDPDPLVRIRAWQAWVDLAKDRPTALVEMLTHSGLAHNSDLRWWFRERFLDVTAHPSLILAYLCRTLTSDSDPERRAEAADLIALLPPDVESIPALVTALRDEAGYVRWRAARALVPLGELAGVAAPALIASWLENPPFHDYDENHLAAATAWALLAIGFETTIPLMAALDDPDQQRQWRAMRLLGLMRVPGTGVELGRFFSKFDDDSRDNLATILLEFEEDVPGLVEFWLQELTREGVDEFTRVRAIDALRCLGPRARGACDALRAIDDGPGGYFHEAVAYALQRIGKNNGPKSG